MKKQFYIQPQTDMMSATPQSVICTSTNYGGETPEGGMGGEAPVRTVQGLKYLI